MSAPIDRSLMPEVERVKDPTASPDWDALVARIDGAIAVSTSAYLTPTLRRQVASLAAEAVIDYVGIWS